MSDQLLAELAQAADLSIDWVDAHGQAQRVTPEAQRTLLEALGYPAQSPEQLRASLAALVQQRHVPEDAALLFQDQGQPLTLTLYPADSPYRLTDEQGNTSEGRLDANGHLPAHHQPGYYQLEIRDTQHRLAVAPATCLSVQELCGKPRIWGLAVQLYGLRREGDGGLGDTQAVADLARHAADQGADALALSPVHAPFGAEVQRFGPYSPSSRLFFNSLYAAPAMLLGQERVDRAIQRAGLAAEMARLQALELIDWPAVATARQRLLRQLYADFREAPGELLGRFEAFCQQAGEPLQQHCCFEAIHAQRLREGASGDWRTWPEALRSPTQGAVIRFTMEHADELRFQAFCQWLIAHGLECAQATASGAGMGIGLIADLAVGADCAGSQAWSRQAELLPSVTVGAPPDILSRQGQNWGVAAFSPQGLRQHGFRAYIEMLQANLAHAGGIRIDHVMGLQRLWVIPEGAEPLQGAYLRYPLDDLLRLLALESHRHRALVIGEDLGTVPEGLRDKLAARNILGTGCCCSSRTTWVSCPRRAGRTTPWPPPPPTTCRPSRAGSPVATWNGGCAPGIATPVCWRPIMPNGPASAWPCASCWSTRAWLSVWTTTPACWPASSTSAVPRRHWPCCRWRTSAAWSSSPTCPAPATCTRTGDGATHWR